MKLVAIVKYKYNENANWKVMRVEHFETKQEFKQELESSGFIIKYGFIFTEEQFKDGSVYKELQEKENNNVIDNEQNKINENTIVINFKNIISELETKNLKLCFVRQRSWFIVDSQNNMYQMEMYRQGSYLDQLIKDGITVQFNYVDASLSKNIGEWEKEIWDVTKVKDFIKRQKL